MAYHHPYEPYAIQKDFMDALYTTLDSKKLGIFESPTGTGKTLSLICPAISWLRDAEKRQLQDELDKLDSSSGPKWSINTAKSMRIAQYKQKGQVLKDITNKVTETLAARTVSKQKVLQPKKRVKVNAKPLHTSYILEDSVLDAETMKLLNSIENVPNRELESLKTPVKIFFTSRTHSQLTQLVDSLKKLKVASSWSDDEYSPIKHVPLGSRKQLCINSEVRSLPSTSQMNDRCMELQKSGGCTHRKAPTVPVLEEAIVSKIRDIEDLSNLGEELGACPYYASRAVIPFCEIVTLPYPLLLQNSTRKMLDIDLKNCIVIIDEAHNLMDTISGLNSESVTQEQVKAALLGLKTYNQKVGDRLSTSNRVRLQKVVKVVDSLYQFFKASQSLPVKERVPGVEINKRHIFAHNNADTINLFELQEFLSVSKLAFKVDSYLRQAEKESGEQGQFSQESLVLGRITEFLILAMDPLSEGKLYYDRSGNGELSIKYLLLDTSNQFRDIVDEARCVVLAGGTMAPMDDYINHLFPYVRPEFIEIFSCGHIIPKSNLMVCCVEKGPSGVPFELTFAKRNDPGLIKNIGLALLNLIPRIPAGVVIFFPSYAYAEAVLKIWAQEGIQAKLHTLKPIFKESRAERADKVLSDYTDSISSGKGGCLLAVVGGKLSEGINFNDDLARGLIMIGIPFPNAFSAQMVARKDHITRKALERGGSRAEALQQAKDLYENTAMRAVNQSIGRAIRHKSDYAAVFLFDSRFGTERIQRKLSPWIRDAILEQGCDPVAKAGAFFAAIHG